MDGAAAWPPAPVSAAPATAGWVTGSAARRARAAPGAGSRKMARTSGGAAMSSTITDCTTRTMSTGTPVSVCMVTPPARRAPKSRPANSTPTGWDRPSSATVIASKPKDPATEVFSVLSVPATWVAPARPARPPEIAMAAR